LQQHGDFATVCRVHDQPRSGVFAAYIFIDRSIIQSVLCKVKKSVQLSSYGHAIECIGRRLGDREAGDNGVRQADERA
jgi:hypothetical protein